MSSLEQSLDAIIAQNSKGKKPARRTIKGSKRPSIQSKSTVSKVRSNVRTRAPTVRGVAPRRSIQRPVAPASSQKVTRVSIQTASLDVATKVIVSGLPKDLDQKTIREFFQGSVGPVSNLTLAYNERGRSTGVATITFKNSKSARAAVARFNNANIDGGNSRLKLEIIVDTSKVPLSARIQPNLSQPVRSQQPNQPPVRRGRQAQTLKGRPGRAVNRPNKVSNKKDAPKKQPKKKKTIEELDQEMADYFATNNN